MKGSSKAKKQPVVVFISDDDSTSGEPVKKKVARKERDQPSVPSHEVLELRRKVAELEKKSRPTDEVLELRKKVADLKNTVKMLKNVKGERMEILESQLEMARLDASQKSKLVDELQKSLANHDGSEEVKEARRNEANMKTKLMESLSIQAKIQTSIDELKRRLAYFEGQQRVQKSANLLQLVEKHIPERIHDPKAINLDPASSDLFLPYKPGMQGTVSLRHAKNLLLPLYDDDMKAYLQKSDFVDEQRLICALCHATVKGYHILIHFFTKAHAKKVQRSGASVSAAAVSYWQQQMEEARPHMVEAMKERIRAAAGAD